MLMQSFRTCKSEYVDNASIGSAPIKVITDISDDEVDMVSANEIDYKALSEDEVVFNDIVSSSTTYRKNNKEVTSDKLSKI